MISLLMLVSFNVSANDVAILKVEFTKSGDTWRVNTTVRHNDTGWEHYADAWRIVNEKGDELGKRILHHPHEKEQPFTRSLHNLHIPKGTTIVYVEAHDKVHGWSKGKVKVDLNEEGGKRFKVNR